MTLSLGKPDTEFPRHSILLMQPGLILQYSIIYAATLLRVAAPLHFSKTLYQSKALSC